MVFGLPAIGETSWGQKILDSINAVKATADAAVVLRSGTGTPEGVVTAPPGSTYVDTSASTCWVKVTGAGNTGWVPNIPFVGAKTHTVAAQSFVGGWVPINFDAEDFDTSGFHSTAADTHKFVAQYTGKYELNAVISYALNATGSRFISWMINGTTRVGVTSLPSAGTAFRTRPFSSVPVHLNAGDFVHLEGYQDSGSALEVGDTTPSGAVGETWASLQYLGKG